MQSSSINQFECIFNKKVHQICSQPVCFGCSCSDSGQKHNDTYIFTCCLKCLSDQCDYTGKFKCPNTKCNKDLNKNSILNDSKLPLFKKIYGENIKANLKDLTIGLFSSLFDMNQRLKDKLQNKTYLIESCFDFIEENLIIRVESLKVDLEKLNLRLCKKIDTFQEVSHQTQSEKLRNSKTCLINFEQASKLCLNEKFNLIKLNISKLKEMKNLSEKIIMPTKNVAEKNHRAKNSILAENDLYTKEMIGYLYGSRFLNLVSIDLINPVVKIVDLSSFLKSACGLTEIYNNTGYSLALTDFELSSLNFIEKYDSFMGKEIHVDCLKKIKEIKFKNYYAICTNNLNFLYVCDMELHRVLIFDYKNFILKRVICGLGINGEERRRLEFDCPRDICFFKNKLYILDQGAYSIDTFSESGDFIKSFMFNEKTQIQIENPWSVRVTENLMVIVDWRTRIFIYDLSGQLKDTIECVNVLSVCFLGINDLYAHCENGDFICYKLLFDESQLLKSFLILKKNFRNLKYRSEFMIYASNQKFILSLGWKKALAIIEF